MDERRGYGSGKTWMSADLWLKMTEDTPDVSFRSMARPVFPVSDAECYALNPPVGSLAIRRQAGIRRAGGRHVRRADAEQAARQEAARRIDLSSDMILRMAEGDA